MTTGSVARMGLPTAIAGAASGLTGLFAGTLVDRLDRRRLMVVREAARAVLYGLMPVCWAVAPQVWLLSVVTGSAAVFDTLLAAGGHSSASPASACSPPSGAAARRAGP
jgi:MFS family permease